MDVKKYKTTINCNNCKNTVTPFLNKLEGVERWEVDTDNSDKVLSVRGPVNEEDVISTLKKIGFKAEPI